MSKHDWSIVVITPAANLEAANSMTVQMGMTDQEFSRPLLSSGSETPTHYGLRADATQWWVTLYTSGNPPATAEHTSAEVQAFLDTLIMDAKHASEIESPLAHWDAVLEQQELTEPVAELP